MRLSFIDGISSHLEIDIQPSSTKAVKTEKLSIQTIENRLETEINSTQEIKFGGYKDVSPPSIKKNNVKRFRATKHLKQILNYNQVIRYKTDYKPVVKKIVSFWFLLYRLLNQLIEILITHLNPWTNLLCIV